MKKKLLDSTGITDLTGAKKMLDKKNSAVYKMIKSKEKSVGVHVRRGDMRVARFNTHPLTPQYFVGAINQECFKEVQFYFFF